MNDTFSAIAETLRQATRIGVACHIRPDGDAIGSITAFGHSLRLAGKEVFICSEDGVPENLRFLPGVDQVQISSGNDLHLDVAVALDNATKDRLGVRTLASFASAPLLVNMDHHGTNTRYGHLNFIDPVSPAAGQIVYDFLSSEGFQIDEIARQNLYAAISTDTGSFQYSSTTAHTHQIISEMMLAGSRFSEICQHLYQTYPKRRLFLQRALLNEMHFCAGDRVASWGLTQELQQQIGVRPGDTEGLIDILRCTEGVIAAAIFEEQKDGSIRVSARSKDARLDVSKVCAEYGGGGHRLAAGARLSGPLADAESRFLESLTNEIQRID